jgi:hypothetical protein
MKKLLGIALALLVSSAAFAADNAVIVTPGVGVTLKSKDIGAGVQAMQPIISDTAGAPIYGTAGTANANVITVQGIASMTPLFLQSGTVPVVTMNSANANSGVNAAMAGVFDDTSPTAITENSFGFLRMSANRNLYGTIRDAAGNERGANVNASNQLAVAGPVTVVSGGIASGAVASGAVASGAVAAGALAAGAGVDGWDLTQGAIADASVAAGATGSISAKLRRISTDIGTVATNSALPLPAQTGIGNVNIGAVQSAGSAYETVAASQTAQALGATGATGDYLSHCVIYPASTSPGVVTVFDNTNAAGTNVIAFAGGASSTSNLTPISVPVGAISTAGAWKVTTGANVSVACFGKFT